MKYTSCSAENGTFIDMKLACSRCGYSVNSNDHFCPHCGKELQILRTTIPFACIVDILNERFRPAKAKDTAEDIKPKTDKAEKAESRIEGAVLTYIDHRFDALESKIFRPRITTLPNSDYSDEKIVADIDYELSKEARNDTLATDRITRLANRIEFYGCTDAEFAEKNRYWKARVAYLRHGDFPNPGIDRNGHTFTKILKECVEMIRPPEEVE